jgi:hypothetical protein
MSRRRRFIGGGLGVGQGVKLWLDASDTSPTNIINSSGKVSLWADKSGNGNNATQGTGSSQPTTGVATSNGKNLIRFDGSNDTMMVTANTTIDNIFDGGGSVFVVYAPISFGGRILDKRGATQAGWSYYHNDSLGSDAKLLFQQDGAVSQYGYVTDDRVVTLNQVSATAFTWDSTTPATATVFYTDSSAPVATSTLNTGSGASVSDAARNFFIGNRDDLVRGAQIDVGEIIVYDRTLSAAEITQVQSYLTNKWLGFKTPTDIQGLQAWYDTTSDDYLTLDGTAITQCIDRSGQGNNTAVQGTASSRPTRALSQINGLQAATFDGGDFLNLPSALYSVSNGDSTIFIISRGTSNTTQQASLSLRDGAVATNQFRYNIDAVANRVGFSNVNNNTTTNWVKINSIDTESFNIFRMGVDGVNQSLSINNATATSNANVVNRTATIGEVGYGGGSLYLTGGIAEILIFNRALTTTEIDNINTYLSNKYNIGLA